MPHKIFTCTHRVGYAECTVGNHVYHSRFLDIVERARGEFFRSLNCTLLQLQEEDVVFPVTECSMKFHSMARYDDLLSIELWLTDLRRAQFSHASRVKNHQEVVLFEGVIRLGCTTGEGKIRRMPAPLIEVLRKYLAPRRDPDGQGGLT